MDATTLHTASLPPLLEPEDPAVATIVNPGGRGPFFMLVCHAGQAIPSRLGSLGLDGDKRARHIGWDIGAAEMARRLAARLDGPAVLASYSRLVVDLNRLPGTFDSIPAESDGVVVPGNQGLDEAARSQRIDSLFWPYHNLVADAFATRWNNGHPAALVAVHTFTPCLNGGNPRPWEVGILWNRDDRLAAPMIRTLREQGLCVGENEPYSGRDRGFSMDYHAGDAGLPHVAIEVRQDLVATPAGAARWASIVAEALGAALRTAGGLKAGTG